MTEKPFSDFFISVCSLVMVMDYGIDYSNKNSALYVWFNTVLLLQKSQEFGIICSMNRFEDDMPEKNGNGLASDGEAELDLFDFEYVGGDDDPDGPTEEDALEATLRPIYSREPEVSHSENFAWKMERGAKKVLEGMGVEDWNLADRKWLAYFCRVVNIHPDHETVPIALADLACLVIAEDYAARSMSEPMERDDILQKGSVIGELDKYQKAATRRGASYLVKHGIKDPILEGIQLRARLERLRKEEVPQEEEAYREWHSQVEEVESYIATLISHESLVEDVQERREAGVRFMTWLLHQDFMRLKVPAADRAHEEEIIFGNTSFATKLKQTAAEESPLNLGQAVEKAVEYVSALLSYHERSGVDRTNWTARDYLHYDVAEKRLTQVGAVSKLFLDRDIKDRIYEPFPVSEDELECLDKLYRQIYDEGRSAGIAPMLDYLPGGAIREQSELDLAYAEWRLGNRTPVELLGNIDTILNQNDFGATLETVEELMGIQRRDGTDLSKDLGFQLADVAFQVLRQLSYTYGYSVSLLLGR